MPIKGDGRGAEKMPEKTPGEAVDVGVRSDSPSGNRGDSKSEITGRQSPIGGKKD